MDLSTENFNYYEPFDTSSLIKCRNSSTFLISMKSPSLQKLPQSTKKIPHKLPPNPKSANVNKNSISSPEEVSRLRSLIFDEKKELQYQRILETKSLKISQLQEEIKILKKPESNLNISGNMNNELNNHKNNENYEEAIFLLKQNLQYTVEKCSMALKVPHKNNKTFFIFFLKK